MASPLALVLLSQFILFIGVGAVIPSIPLYGKVLGLSNKLNGIVISAPAVASLLASKAAGRFADRARKPAMSIGMAVIIASDIGTALANSLLTLTLARFGLGLGRIVSESGERGLLADLARGAPELRGRALAAQQAVMALGIAIGAPAGGVVVEQYGPRASFLCVSAAACVAFVLYQCLPETVVALVWNVQIKIRVVMKRTSGLVYYKKTSGKDWHCVKLELVVDLPQRLRAYQSWLPMLFRVERLELAHSYRLLDWWD